MPFLQKATSQQIPFFMLFSSGFSKYLLLLFLQRKLRTAKKESDAANAEQQQQQQQQQQRPRYEPIDYEEDLDFSLQVAPAHHGQPGDQPSPAKPSQDQVDHHQQQQQQQIMVNFVLSTLLLLYQRNFNFILFFRFVRT